MKFDPKITKFAGHQTFHLRYSWITKGFRGLMDNPKIFEIDDAIVKFGVGKNMVASIQYWLRACQIIEREGMTVTKIGDLIFNERKGYDCYLEDEATIWLIHWLLASNPSVSTGFYWFFNKFHKLEFTTDELKTALRDFITESSIKKKVSEGTINQDAVLIPRMYTQSKGNTSMKLEDALDSPMSLLRLINRTSEGRCFYSKLESRPSLPIGIFGFAISQLLEAREEVVIPIEELMYSQNNYPAIGSIFRLTENDLLTKLEKLIDYIPKSFEIRESAGIHQLYKIKDTINPYDYLWIHYKQSVKGKAA